MTHRRILRLINKIVQEFRNYTLVHVYRSVSILFHDNLQYKHLHIYIYDVCTKIDANNLQIFLVLMSFDQTLASFNQTRSYR